MVRKSMTWFGLLVCLVLLASLAVPALAAEGPVHTDNDGLHEYLYDRWARPVRSYLARNDDGTFTRVEYTGSEVAVERYDRQFRFLEGSTIECELPLFGGCHLGEEYNFLIFGQTNTEEDDDREVIRVVKYTKDWVRLDSAGLYGVNTTEPFDAGSLRCLEHGGYLYIRTSHQMYTSDDGLRHQANLTTNIRIGDMTVCTTMYRVSNIGAGYVSHSFDQYLGVDGEDLLAVDLGDAYPRSVVLVRYVDAIGQDSFLRGDILNYPMLPIAGSVGANDTGVSIGGFLVSDRSYLVAGNTTAQEEEGYDPHGQRNIFISALSRDGSTRTIRYLTDYQEGDGVEISNPRFVQTAKDRFLVMWEVGSKVHYVFVDGTGAPVGQTHTATGRLSDQAPIVSDGKVIWYVTRGGAPIFYTVDLKTNALSAQIQLDAPQILSCYSKEQTSVRVQWTEVEGAEGYQLYRTTDPEDAGSWRCVKTITDGSRTSYTNQNLTEGVTYYYKVRAFAGEDARVYSAFSQAHYMPAAVVFDGPYSNSSFRIRLRWERVAGADGYQICRQDDTGTYRVVKTITSGETTAYSNVSLDAGCRYTYRMRAYYLKPDGGKAFGPYSDEVTVGVQPKAPAVTVTSPKSGRAELTWDAVNGADGFQIWISDRPDSGFAITKRIERRGITTYTKQGLESGKTYYFKVRGWVEVGGKKTFGAFSQTVAIRIS